MQGCNDLIMSQTSNIEVQHPPVVLTIAGLDPSGGAGVIADVRTFSAFGVRLWAYAMLLSDKFPPIGDDQPATTSPLPTG